MNSFIIKFSWWWKLYCGGAKPWPRFSLLDLRSKADSTLNNVLFIFSNGKNLRKVNYLIVISLKQSTKNYLVTKPNVNLENCLIWKCVKNGFGSPFYEHPGMAFGYQDVHNKDCQNRFLAYFQKGHFFIRSMRLVVIYR